VNLPNFFVELKRRPARYGIRKPAYGDKTLIFQPEMTRKMHS
jgi:hypothetical protein